MRKLVWMLPVIVAMGCGSNQNGPDGGDMGRSAAFAQVQQQVFSAHCGGIQFMSCHLREPFGGGMDLREGHAYASLVGVKATAAPSKLRVKPGDPANSFLVQKLTNTQGPAEGDPMPKGEAIRWVELPSDLIDLVQSWIAQGAQ